MKPSAPTPKPAGPAEEIGLPCFRSWKAVYLFVLATFALWIALLTVLTKAFS